MAAPTTRVSSILDRAGDLVVRGPHGLAAALTARDAEQVRRLLAQGADPNAILPTTGAQAGPMVPLAWVVFQAALPQGLEPWEEIIDVLLEHGAHIVPPGPALAPVQHHPLGMAVGYGRLEAFCLLFPRLSQEERARLSLPLSLRACTADMLEMALSSGNPMMANALLDAGVQPSTAGVYPPALALGLEGDRARREGALVCACATESGPSVMVPLVERLLTRTWPQFDLDWGLRTAIRAAAPAPTIQALLDAGASVAIHPSLDDGKSVVVQAIARLKHPAPGVVAALLAAGCPRDTALDFSMGAIDPEDIAPASPASSAAIRGAHPIHLAASMGHADALAELLAAGADPNAPDATGKQPMFHALRHASEPTEVAPLVRHLLAAGADPVALDPQGLLPMERWLEGHASDPTYCATDLATARQLLELTLTHRPDVARTLWLALPEDPELDPMAQVWANTLESFQLAQDLGRKFPQASAAPKPRM